MHLRDEAHRFGITFHRKKRTAQMLLHELNHISGLGEASVEKLLSEYKTMARIRAAGYDNVVQVLGARSANALLEAGFFA
jgi:excinuclease ABC subunit C